MGVGTAPLPQGSLFIVNIIFLAAPEVEEVSRSDGEVNTWKKWQKSSENTWKKWLIFLENTWKKWQNMSA